MILLGLTIAAMVLGWIIARLAIVAPVLPVLFILTALISAFVHTEAFWAICGFSLLWLTGKGMKALYQFLFNK